MPYTIRPAEDKDREAINTLFNHFVTTSMAAYPEKPYEGGVYDRLRNAGGSHPFLVAATETGAVIAFAQARPYHGADSIRRTAEITYFILPEHQGHGLGERLLNKLIELVRPIGVDNLLGSISSHNEQSLKFHQKHGFVEVGRFRKVGRKWGKDFDLVWVQRFIG
ncbi:GNAT family N-acetyltransferase [candidate division GN15 bacterium]|uniref:GNAT family N-acetyltransferase n=1 Tax=candidate division GN15 bacterium TaxID=2072418 RepID=A0A855X1E3_9BACT|nr:MAG: GNAT family N-acetyltransferase [candidate division GN15 bacterium]